MGPKLLCGGCAGDRLTRKVYKIFTRNEGTRVASGTRIAIGFSGSPSCVLLVAELLKICAREHSPTYTLLPIHVREPGVSDELEAAAATADLLSVASSLGIDLISTSVEEELLGDAEVSVGDLMGNLSARSDREELAVVLRERALLSAAVRLGGELLVLGDTATQVAIDSLMHFVNGRGEQLHTRGQVVSEWGAGLSVVRPLVDTLASDVHAICAFDPEKYPVASRYTAAAAVGGGSAPVSSASSSSLRGYTSNFIRSLQADFPATIQAVAKIVRKLESPSLSPALCSVCRGPLPATHAQPPPHAQYEDLVQSFGVVDTPDSSAPHACYGCRHLLTDNGDGDGDGDHPRLPPSLIAEYIIDDA